MERELFALMVAVLDAQADARYRPPKCQYTDRDILIVLLWAALHDRPIDWACQRRHWPPHDRVRPLPSGATMSRRLRTDSILELLLRLVLAIQLTSPDGLLLLDAKPLPIAWHSTDPDAGVGRGAGGLAKGYKLHTILDFDGNVQAFAVFPLNVSEQAAAELLITQLHGVEGRTMLADANYDSNRLYDLAGERGVQLLAQRRYQNAKGIGHHRHSPHRLEALRRMAEDETLLDPRRRIEGYFGTLGNVIGGLNGLPNRMRRLQRVERWVIAKLIIDAAHRRRRSKRHAA